MYIISHNPLDISGASKIKIYNSLAMNGITPDGSFYFSGSQDLSISGCKKIEIRHPSGLIGITKEGKFFISSQSTIDISGHRGVFIRYPSGSINIDTNGDIRVSKGNKNILFDSDKFYVSSNFRLSGGVNFATTHTLTWDLNDGIVVSGSNSACGQGNWNGLTGKGLPGISCACGWIKIKLICPEPMYRGGSFYGFIPLFSANRVNLGASNMMKSSYGSLG